MKAGSLRHNMVMNTILIVSGVVIPLITYPYVARILQPEGMGKVAFATSVITYFKVIAQLGIPTYGTRQCAMERDNNDNLSKIVTQLIVINIVTVCISMLLLGLSIFLIPKLKHYIGLLFILSIDLIFGTLNVEWFYKGMEQFDYITKRSLVCRILIMALTFLIIHKPKDYYLYASLTALSSIIIFFINIRNMKGVVKCKKNYLIKQEMLCHFKPIIILCASVIMTTVCTSIDTVMVGIFCGDFDVGIYSVAAKIKTVLVSLGTAPIAIYLPRLSKYYKENDVNNFRTALSRGLQLVFIYTLPIVVFIMFTAPSCIKLVAGSQYMAAVPAMWILMPTVLIIGISYLLGAEVLIAIGRQTKYLITVTVAAGADILFNLIFIPVLDSAGAAIGTLIAETISLAVGIYFIRDITKNIVHKLNFIKPMTGCSISVVVLIGFQYSLRNTGIGFIAMFLLLGTIYIGTYIVSMILLRERLCIEILHSIKGKISKH